jgi:hypothetical protein
VNSESRRFQWFWSLKTFLLSWDSLCLVPPSHPRFRTWARSAES